MTLKALRGMMCNDVNNITVLQQVIYMPVETFFAPAVSGDPGFQTAQRAAGVYVISRREVEFSKLANLYSSGLR